MLENLIRAMTGRSRLTHKGHGDFNHCSSICKYNKGVLLAWYSAKAECDDDQSVCVSYINEYGEKSDPISIGEKTGNPVLINTDICETPTIMWSKFEDSEIIKRKSDRWKTCSLWIQRIIVKNNKPYLITKKEQLTDPSQHLLGRCNPEIVNTYQYGGEVVLPLYDEVERKCVIFGGNDMKYSEYSRYGDNIIQPTLWQSGDRIFSLSRNFPRSVGSIIRSCEIKTKALLYESIDLKTWSGPIETNLWNVNNSAQVVRWRDNSIILWNDTPTISRVNLTLGILNGNSLDAEKVTIVGESYGSYPSMCVDNLGNLHLSFTNHKRQIEHHVWTYGRLRRARRASGNRS